MVYLDDECSAPDGRATAHWPDEVVCLLETGPVTHVGLDRELGDDARGAEYGSSWP